jgi:hypothetical protein
LKLVPKRREGDLKLNDRAEFSCKAGQLA